MILDFLVAVAIGMLAGLGIGSGGFLIIYLVFFRGLAQAEAQGINLWFFIFALACACIVNIKKRKISPKIIVLMLFPGMAGAIFGGYILSFINTEMLGTIFGIFLLAAGVYTAFSK